MITVEISTALVNRKLTMLAAAVKNRSPINRKIAIALQGIVFRNFRDQGNDGIPWAPLKAGGRWVGMKGGKGKSRFAGKRRLDTSAKILMDTGALRNSFMPFSDDVYAGVGAQSAKNHADIAPMHEFGVPARNLPARPMLPSRRAALEKAIVIYGLELQRWDAGS